MSWSSSSTGIFSLDLLLFARSLSTSELTSAPSSSRRLEASCRRNLIINFDTSRQPVSSFPGSMSIHCRSRSGIDTEDNVNVDVCRGRAFATSFPVLLSRTLQRESLLTFLSRICWLHSRSKPKNKFCHKTRIRS